MGRLRGGNTGQRCGTIGLCYRLKQWETEVPIKDTVETMSVGGQVWRAPLGRLLPNCGEMEGKVAWRNSAVVRENEVYH